MKKIEAIIQPDKFDEVKEALNSHGVKGITITQVLGHGNQKGKKQLYRGIQTGISLLPKIKLEVVVADSHVDEIIDVVLKTAHTDTIGDGKIFIYNVEEAIRIRTGEKGETAL